MALFYLANPLAVAVMGFISVPLLEMDGLLDLRGWQWLFLIEGLPALILAFVVLIYLPDGPKTSRWFAYATARSSRNRPSPMHSEAMRIRSAFMPSRM